jgi:hypothetical protein
VAGSTALPKFCASVDGAQCVMMLMAANRRRVTTTSWSSSLRA